MNPATKWILNQFKGSGLTQQKFTEKCGVCMLQIGRWERGEQDPYPVSIRKVAPLLALLPRRKCFRQRKKPDGAGILKKRRNLRSQNRKK